MKKIIVILAVIFCQVALAQDKGTIKGKLLDGDMNNEPLSYASVILKGTTTGTETDEEGNYSLTVKPGNYTVIFSFLGYKTIEVPVTVKVGEALIVNRTLKAEEGVALDEVKVRANTTRERESALLLEQKNATTIKESIGAERLSKIGVSNAATATTKISGVARSEGTGDIYIRGLGDRYLFTTMNGLPVPSDDVQNKNINLSLFSTNLINNIGISKTYSVSGYADQSSGTVNVVSKKYSRKGYSIGFNGGVNTAVSGLSGNFKKSIISEDVTLGFHQKQYLIPDAITFQGWDPLTKDNTTNFGLSFSGAERFKLFGNDLSIFATGSYSQSYEYREGIFRSYRANIEDNGFPRSTLDPATVINDSPSVQDFYTNFNTMGYIRGDYKIGDNHTISYNTLMVNRAQDRVYEAGRNGIGYVFDQQPQENGAFIRDQNFTQTLMYVNQLMGTHKLSEKNELKWAAGYNFVLAEEPNRIRNEGNIIDPNGTFTYAFVGDFQQRKSSQKIEDEEVSGYVEDQYSFGEMDEDENRPFRLNVGANFRYKERSFRSQFVGVAARDFTVSSVDDISDTFITDNFSTPSGQPRLILREQQPDIYAGELTVFGGYASLDFGLNKKFSGNVGLRYEFDQIDVTFDVGNFIQNGIARVGSANKEYTDVYPSVNLKYELNEKNFLRFSSSITQTLPEFKEFAPFEYVNPTGRVVRGNPDLERSKVFNVDLKWEFFPSREELFSATAFFKKIQDPINLAQARGSAGIFQFFNTGDNATVFGLELEGRVNILENEDERSILSAIANMTFMSTNQDLFEQFQYFDVLESNLQGASDFIFNGSISYNSRTEKELVATLTGNYASDRILVLGGPEDLANRATLFNDEILEKGFVSLDLVVSKKLDENFTLRLVGRNLLNPAIEQTQRITLFDVNDIIVNQFVDTVQSYKKGSQITLGVTYKF